MRAWIQGLTPELINDTYYDLVIAWTVWIWLTGLIGMIRTGSIRRTYGSLVSGGWGFLRVLRSFTTFSMIGIVISNKLIRMTGTETELAASNVVGFILMILLNILVIMGDKRRFDGHCDRSLARRIIRAEWQMACSVVTRISLIITISTVATLFVFTDTADYYRDDDGNIYRVKDPMSL